MKFKEKIPGDPRDIHEDDFAEDPPEYSRREILDASLKTFGGVLLASLMLGTKSDTYIPPEYYELQEKKRKEEIARPSAEIRIDRTESEDKVEVTPEYRRHMERLFIILPYRFRYMASGGRNLPLEWLRQNIDFFESLPAYAKLDLVTDKNGESVLQEALDKMGIKTEINIRPMWASGILNMDEWSQDTGEICRINGRDIFLIPRSYKPASWKESRQAARKRMARKLFRIENVKEADFYFQGGNMTFDVTEQGLRVFVGFDDLVLSTAKGLDLDFQNLIPSDYQAELRRVAEKISEQFGGAEVIVMGNKRQSKRLVHIDQSFIILEGGHVVVTEVNDKSLPEYELQEYYKRQLADLGYKVATVEHTREEIENNFTSLNAVPFVDKRTGQKKIIYPVFPSQVKGDFEAVEPIKKDDLQGTALAAYKLFESLGYKPYPVRDHNYKKKGNTHCITNVLASLDDSVSGNALA